MVPHPVSSKANVAGRPRGPEGGPGRPMWGPPGPPQTQKNQKSREQLLRDPGATSCGRDPVWTLRVGPGSHNRPKEHISHTGPKSNDRRHLADLNPA